MKKLFIVIPFLFLQYYSIAQERSISNKNILFIGNSYTYVNDLPLMIANVSLSTNDTISYNSSTPGGYTFNNHTQDTASISKIKQGNWDFVVLQEQSQLPSFPIGQVSVESFPYAKILDSIINTYNSCAETVFYMTWGRKNGDASNCASWPPVCTYQGMDSLLRDRYTQMAFDNKTILSPVGALWHYLRLNNPSIELYSSDESHPSVAGTYAAACSFYSVIFRKNPTFITYNSTLTIADAIAIRNAAKAVVYDSLQSWFVGDYDPNANFNSSATGLNLSFTNTSQNANQYFWDFGDGETSTDVNPSHSFLSGNTYSVKLIAYKCDQSDTITKQIVVTPQQIDTFHSYEIELFPNPSNGIIFIQSNKTISFDKYQIFNNLGQLVDFGNLKFNIQKQTIDINKLQNGVFSIAFINSKNQNILIRKIIKIG
jgi:hypothetical protein